MKNILIAIAVLFLSFGCGRDNVFLSGYVRRANDAILVSCDPYGSGRDHTCLVFSAAFQNSLYVYDATAHEMVLGPGGYLPLKVAVGPSTDRLIKVISRTNQRFPYMLAFDQARSSYFVVRLFPSSVNGLSPFEKPDQQILNGHPSSMGAVDHDKKVIAILIHQDQAAVELLAIDGETGRIDTNIPPAVLPLGVAPRDLAIDPLGKKVVITDRGRSELHVLDIKNLWDVLNKKAELKARSFDVGIRADGLSLSIRDLGQGPTLYAVLFDARGKEIRLVDVDGGKPLGKLALNSFPMAIYFPDAKSKECCDGQKNWLAIASIKGEMEFIAMIPRDDGIALERATSFDLRSERNLALNSLRISTICGGEVLSDPTIKKERLCPSGRETFFVSSYADSKSYRAAEPIEIEGHGHSCEGEASASRLGIDGDR